MARIEGINRDEATGPIATTLDAQERKWGAPLANHLIYARRPAIFRGARAMWGGLDQSGLLDPALVALVNVRVAFHNRCEF
jgi:alkylhydroperoxidase family enzyme